MHSFSQLVCQVVGSGGIAPEVHHDALALTVQGAHGCCADSAGSARHQHGPAD
jgi:hypothetical protein